MNANFYRYQSHSSALAIGLMGMVLVLGFFRDGSAQVPRSITVERWKKPLIQIPERDPRFRSAEDVDSFIESLSSNDARFEVILGQGRLLTLKQDIAVAGRLQPTIAVGDSSVVEFRILSLRHLRLIGLRIGVTDLSILTGDRENYSLEVHVVADLDYLRGRLRQTFPHAKIKLGHMREHLIVEGEARDVSEKQQIIKTIDAYLKSIQADVVSQQGRVGTGEIQEERSGENRGNDQEEETGGEVVSDTGTAAAPGQSAEPKIIDLIRTPDPLEYLRVDLRKNFPDAQLELRYLGSRIMVEGQARDTRQIKQILEAIQAHLESVQAELTALGEQADRPGATNQTVEAVKRLKQSGANVNVTVLLEEGGATAPQGTPLIINLIRVPGPQQVMLKVQVAELNRTALRQIGADLFVRDGNTTLGSVIGSSVSAIETSRGVAGDAVASAVEIMTGIPLFSTAFGVFDNGDFVTLLAALRQNGILKILAEPNLVAMNGQTASFHSGGRFPVPIPQPSGGGGASLVTIQFEEFGVLVDFVPHILDGDTIRLAVNVSVSSIDFASGVTIQGTAVPGVAERTSKTVVELREGQTLAIAGLLQIEMSGDTRRIPFLGDLPYIGPMFSTTSHQTAETELVFLVTPYIVEPMEADEVPPLPGADVQEPDDLEFYLKGRIEKRADRPYRATTAWDDPLGLDTRRRLEQRYIIGPYGSTP